MVMWKAEAGVGACERTCEPNQEGRAGAIGERPGPGGRPQGGLQLGLSQERAQSRAVGSWSGCGPRGQQAWGHAWPRCGLGVRCCPTCEGQ